MRTIYTMHNVFIGNSRGKLNEVSISFHLSGVITVSRFKRACLLYSEALKRRGRKLNLQFDIIPINKSKERNVTRKHTQNSTHASSPPFPLQCRTNVVNIFLALIDKHSPTNSALNKNTTTVIHSCLPNTKETTSNNHNCLLHLHRHSLQGDTLCIIKKCLTRWH